MTVCLCVSTIIIAVDEIYFKIDFLPYLTYLEQLFLLKMASHLVGTEMKLIALLVNLNETLLVSNWKLAFVSRENIILLDSARLPY